MRARGREYLLLRWVPSHTKFEDIDGLHITEVEWKLNRGADRLATSAAEQHVVPPEAVLGAKRRRAVALAIQRTAIECFRARGQTRPLPDRRQGYTDNYLATLGANPAEPRNSFDEDFDLLARGDQLSEGSGSEVEDPCGHGGQPDSD